MDFASTKQFAVSSSTTVEPGRDFDMSVAAKPFKRILGLGIVVLQIAMCLGTTGCTSLVHPIRTIPAHRVPRQFLAEPQAEKVPIDFTRLRQIPSNEYLLDKGDVLGIFVGGVLGDVAEPPPVNMPTQGSDLPPAIGYPVVVGDDGTISLPLVKPIPVKGLTISQVKQLLFDQYTGQVEGGLRILNPSEAKILVTLMRKRTVQVVVIRQDNAPLNGQQNLIGQQGGTGRTDYSSRGFVISLEAYKNDVLNALAQTGGVPGVNAKAEVTIMRGDQTRWKQRDTQLREWVDKYKDCKDPCFTPPPLPADDNALKIPLRVAPGTIPEIKQEDIILNDGDVVLIETRETEIYYTGGQLPGGQFPLPRDFDLDVLGAMAIAGGSIGQNSTLGQGVVGAVGAVPPGQLIVLRRTQGGGQIAISVDLVRAVNDPRSRLLVKAGDTLILRYKPEEELVNFGLGTFFTFGIRELFNNN